MNRSLSLVLIGLALAAPSYAQIKPQKLAKDLWQDMTHNLVDPQMGKFPLLREGRRVALDFDLLDKAKVGDRLRLKFNKDFSYVALLQRREDAPTLKNGYHWHGTLEGKQSSQFIITVDDTGIASWFTTMDNFVYTFTVEGSRKQTYARIYDDAANHAKSATPPYVNKALQTYMDNGGILNSNNNACNDDPNRINMGVYYTVLANAQALGTCAVRVSNGIAQANTCLKNSGLSLRLLPDPQRRGCFATSRIQLDGRLPHRPGEQDRQELGQRAHGPQDRRLRPDRADRRRRFRPRQHDRDRLPPFGLGPLPPR